MIKKSKEESGYSLLEIILAIAMLSGLTLMIARFSVQSMQIRDMISHKSYVMDLQHYIHNNFSCEKTFENIDCVLKPNKKIETYRFDGEILTESFGTDFLKKKNPNSLEKFLVNAECNGNHINFYYTDQLVAEKHLFNELPIVCAKKTSCKAGVHTLSFENFSDGDFIPNNAFENEFGITLTPSAPLKVAKNGTLESVSGGQHAYECGVCGSKASGKRYNGVRNDSDHQVGRFFITDDSKDTSFTLRIDYTNPVTEASGIILDLDPDESWTVKAYSGDDEVYSEVYSGSGKYDGAPMLWKVENDPIVEFDRIELIGQDGNGGPGNFGLAFDNFSPSKICEEFHLP